MKRYLGTLRIGSMLNQVVLVPFPTVLVSGMGQRFATILEASFLWGSDWRELK